MNSHKNGKSNAFVPRTKETEIFAPEQFSYIDWEQAVELSETLSQHHLMGILCQKLGSQEPKIWDAVPIEHLGLLESIKSELSNAPKQLNQVVEAPVATESIVPVEPPTKPAKKRGRQPKAELLAQSQELVVTQVKAVQTATEQRKAKSKANDADAQKNRQRRGRLRAIADITIEEAAYEQVVNAFEDRRKENTSDDLADFLAEINQSLQDSGAKVQVLTDEEIEALKSGHVSEQEAEESFFSSTANLWD